MSYSFREIALIFFFYAVMGWVTEVIYALAVRGKFVNRGFLKGPVCPIYGFGVLLIILLLTPVAKYLPLLFIGSVILTTLLELITGYVLERFFKTKWWDYSNNHFNFRGYICLGFSLLWGLACVFVIDIVQPMVMAVIDKIPEKTALIIILTALALILADFVTTLISMIDMSKSVTRFDELQNKLEEIQENMREMAAEISVKGELLAAQLDEKLEAAAAQHTIRKEAAEHEREEKRAEQAAQVELLKERITALSGEMRHKYRRLFDAFPQVETSIKFEKFKEALEEYRKKNQK